VVGDVGPGGTGCTARRWPPGAAEAGPEAPVIAGAPIGDTHALLGVEEDGNEEVGPLRIDQLESACREGCVQVPHRPAIGQLFAPDVLRDDPRIGRQALEVGVEVVVVLSLIHISEPTRPY